MSEQQNIYTTCNLYKFEQNVQLRCCINVIENVLQ